MKTIPKSKATQFKPGRSGNPNGRPRKLPGLDKLLAEILGDIGNGQSEVKKIILALTLRAKKGDVRAAEILLDRSYGKTKVVQEITSNLSYFDFESLSTLPLEKKLNMLKALNVKYHAQRNQKS